MTVRSQLRRRISKEYHTKQVLEKVSSPQNQQQHKQFFVGVEDASTVIDEYCTSSDEEHDCCYQHQQQQQDDDGIEVEYSSSGIISPSPYSCSTNRKRCDTSGTVTSTTSKGGPRRRVSFGSIHIREYNRTINGIISCIQWRECEQEHQHQQRRRRSLLLLG